MEAKKRDVEDGIMRGLSADSTPLAQGTPTAPSHANGLANSPSPPTADPERPQVESLTPPPPDALTPAPPTPADPRLSTRPAPPVPAGADLLSSLSMPAVRHYADTSGSPAGVGGPMKKRKVEEEYPGFGSGEDVMADLDEDVAELLRAESGGAR